ncbi:MAG: DUF6632 domain-containing protein [Gemmatimonadales bacterium]
MTPDRRLGALRLALIVFGLIFTFCIYPLTILWPSGWSWSPAQPAYLQMIVGIYAVLGVFLMLASKEPAQHRSLIWFTVWSSLVHAAVMAVHAYTDAGQMGHMWGDVAALVLVAVVLGLLAPPRPAA